MRNVVRRIGVAKKAAPIACRRLVLLHSIMNRCADAVVVPTVPSQVNATCIHWPAAIAPAVVPTRMSPPLFSTVSRSAPLLSQPNTNPESMVFPSFFSATPAASGAFTYTLATTVSWPLGSLSNVKSVPALR